jgi:hypothetical protein
MKVNFLITSGAVEAQWKSLRKKMNNSKIPGSLPSLNKNLVSYNFKFYSFFHSTVQVEY